MKRLLRALFVLVLSLLGSTGQAASRRIAVTPVSSHEAAAGKHSAALESALIAALRNLSDVEVANADNNRLRGPLRSDPRADQRPTARAVTLARDFNAELAIAVEPQSLGEGMVVYLQLLQADGKSRGSTTVALSAEALAAGNGEIERLLRGGIIQTLDPARFVGRLDLHVDVKGAQAEIDGRGPAQVNGTPLTLPVGTHALRVTHPAYRDYLRFIEIGFDRTTVENVAMAAFPLTEGEMAEKRRRSGVVTPVKVPWYRSWWALSLTGAVLVGVTTGIVYGVRPGIDADHQTHYRAMPAP